MFQMLILASVILVLEQMFTARSYYVLDGGVITSTVSLVITMTAVVVPSVMLMVSLAMD